MEEGASPPRWALDKKLGEDASMESENQRARESRETLNIKNNKKSSKMIFKSS